MAVAITEQPTDTGPKRRSLWHPSAPRSLVKKVGEDRAAGWPAWQKHLAGRKRPLAPPFLQGHEPPLLWGLDATSRRKLPKVSELSSIVANATDSPAWQVLAAAYSLPEAAQRLSAESWWKLADSLRSLAMDAELLHVDREGDPHDVLRQQLLAGELPLALGYLFPEVQSLRELRKARDVLSEALVEWTDGQGLPHGRLLSVLGPLWACWTRCRWLGERLKRGPWSREAEIQFGWLVRHAIRLTGVDGQFMLADKLETAPAKKSKIKTWPQGLYRTALELVGDRADCAAAASLLPKGTVPTKARFHERDLPEPSLESEWSSVAVLATDWQRSAARFAVSYVDVPMRVELAVGSEGLLSGLWTSRTTCDGEPVQLKGDWEQVCWQSDSKCDFLELSAELSHGLRLERQIILGRADRVLYLADVVVAADGSPRRLSHTLELPISATAKWQPEAETRDGFIISGKQQSAVLPLALSEWRSDPRGGRLELVDNKLTLTQEATGRLALYSPMLIDLDVRRLKKDRTWRQLTVAEMLEAVSHDVAVGFRAQAGRDQWLFYRSLAPAGNRTLLGQNISGEFYAGRILPEGKMDEWIEIEACV